MCVLCLCIVRALAAHNATTHYKQWADFLSTDPLSEKVSVTFFTATGEGEAEAGAGAEAAPLRKADRLQGRQGAYCILVNIHCLLIAVFCLFLHSSHYHARAMLL